MTKSLSISSTSQLNIICLSMVKDDGLYILIQTDFVISVVRSMEKGFSYRRQKDCESG